jgi:signal transduction histidine kinase
VAEQVLQVNQPRCTAVTTAWVPYLALLDDGCNPKAHDRGARESVWNLRQSDNDTANIGEKIQSMTEQVSAEFHVPVAFTMSGTPFVLTHPIAHDSLMVAHEAVFNAVLHGAPSRVEVELAYNHMELKLSVHDNGCGFEVEPREK